MAEKFKAFFRAFVLSAVALLCPFVLTYGIITADINTKQTYLNQTESVVKFSENGDFYVLGKKINKKYFEWTKYYAQIGKKLLPKGMCFAVEYLKS